MKKEHVFTVSDESRNSHGLFVRTSGGDFSEFLKRPVMLLNHNSDNVIGSWKNLSIEGTEIRATAVFSDKTTQAKEIAALVEDGDINGASIGVIPLEFEGNICTRWKLREISITPLPSNTNALKLYNTEGLLLNDDQIKELKLSLDSDNITQQQKMNKLKPKLITLFAKSGLQLNLSADSTDEQFENGIQALELKLNSLQKVETQYIELNASRVNDLVNTAVADKKITEADKPKWLELATTSYDLAKSTLATIKPLNLDINGALGGNKSSTQGADDRKDWKFDDWRKKDSQGLQLMQTSDPEKFNKLMEAHKEMVKANGWV